MSDVATVKAARIITDGRWAASGRLDLSSLGLRHLPDELFAVEGLRVLDLSRNRLADLPIGLFDLVDLEQLDLGGNRLAVLPTAIGRLTALRVLDLSENRLTQLPGPIAECQSLTTVSLYGNSLADVTELAPLIQLDDLDLSSNQLSRAPSLSPQGRLTRLDLSGNKISELPNEYSRLKVLSWLDLSGNQLTGVGPLSGLALTELYLDDNLLPGFPDRMAALPTLRRFSVSGNPFGDPGISSDLADRARVAVELNVTSTEQGDRQYFTGAELILGFYIVVKSVAAVKAGIDLYYKRFAGVSVTVDLPDGSRIQLNHLSRKGALEVLQKQREAAGSAGGGRIYFGPGYEGQVKAAIGYLTQLTARAGETEVVPNSLEKPIFIFNVGAAIMGDYVSIGNANGAIINIRSTLSNTTQTISASAMDDNSKASLTALVDELHAKLADLPQDSSEDAEAVAGVAENLITEVSRGRPNRKLVGTMADALRSLGSGLAAVGPVVLQIIKLVNDIIGHS